MPELPEVETARRGWSALVAGAVVSNVAVHDARVLKGQPPGELVGRLAGSRLGLADRRGKLLLVSVVDAAGCDWTLCIHFMMRGGLRLREALDPPGRYDRVSLALSDGRSLHYEDAWGWGGFRVIAPGDALRAPALVAMGPEPLDASWNATVLGKALRGRGGAVKSVLLDQSVVAGVGNIYADESLHRAGIDPRESASSLGDDRVGRLASAIRDVLAEAVAAGGSVGDYTDLSGNPGRYVPRVYDRAGSPCGTCSTVLMRTKVGGRGTTYCPRCQAGPGDGK